MMRSFAIKLGMLLAVMAAAIWIGWPDAPQTDTDRTASATSPTTAAPAFPTVDRFKAAAHGPTDDNSGRARVPPRPAKLDLNRATAADLQQLPGVGDVLAQRVIDYRTTHGPYRRLEDLLEVQGIGAKRLEQLQLLVTIGPESAKPS
jgi:competence protein ComEA